MRKLGIKLVSVLLIVVGSTQILAQKVEIAPFQVKPSTLIGQIKALRTANPKITAAELAKAADAFLEKNGLPFRLSFDAATCERIRKVRDQQKDPAAPLRLGATLKSVEADRAGLALPSPQSLSCGDCFVELPVLAITDSDFVTIVNERNIKFVLPANFAADEVRLVDAKDESQVKRRWRIPFRSVPIGISFDENVLYLAFPDPDLSDLALMAFGEGVFQIGTRTEAEEGGKGKLLPAKNTPTPTDWQTIRFDRWKQTFILKYRESCTR